MKLNHNESIHGPKQQMVDFSGSSLVSLGRLQYLKLSHQCHPHLYNSLFPHPIIKHHNLSHCFIPLYFLCFSVAMVISVSRIRGNPNRENHHLGKLISQGKLKYEMLQRYGKTSPGKNNCSGKT